MFHIRQPAYHDYWYVTVKGPEPADEFRAIDFRHDVVGDDGTEGRAPSLATQQLQGLNGAGRSLAFNSSAAQQKLTYGKLRRIIIKQ